MLWNTLLYEASLLAVDVEEIRGKSYEEIYGYTYKLDTKFYDLIMGFYSIGYTTPDKVMWVDTNPEFCETMGNFRYRFLIVKYQNDFVFLNIKAATKRSASQVNSYSISRTISASGSRQNEMYVLKALSESDCFKYMIVPSSEKRTEQDYWANNYYNTRESCDFLFTSKFESKRRINKIKSMADIQVYNYCDGLLEEEIFSLLKVWEENRGPKALSDRKALVKLISLMNKSDNIYFMVERVNGKIVAYNGCIAYIDNYIVYRTAKSLGSLGIDVVKTYFDTDDEDFARIIKDASDSYCIQQMFKYFLKDKNFEAVFLEGDDHNKGLGWYKGLMSKYTTFYYKEPLKDYVKSLEVI